MHCQALINRDYATRSQYPFKVPVRSIIYNKALVRRIMYCKTLFCHDFVW